MANDFQILPQVATRTLCVVCHAAVIMGTNPYVTSDITDPCWNPSLSEMSDEKSQNFCKAETGKCFTDTFQYATKDEDDRQSYTVGIRRGCATGKCFSKSEPS